jgi:hypothetical protein
MDLILRPNKPVLAQVLREQALNLVMQMEPTITSAIDMYVKDLHSIIGGISSNSSAEVLGVMWKPLQKKGKTFWFETGEVENAIAVGYKVTATGVQVIAGVSPDSPAYDKTLWNEFGFYPHDSDRLIRRPVFEPLATEQVRELNNLIKKSFSKLKVTIQLKV